MRWWQFLLVQLLARVALIVSNREVVHKAKLASATHIDEVGTNVYLGWVLTEEFLLAELLGWRFSAAGVGVNGHNITGAEVAESSRKPNPGIQPTVKVRTTSEWQFPLAMALPPSIP